jgi:hypothetical protein
MIIHTSNAGRKRSHGDSSCNHRPSLFSTTSKEHCETRNRFYMSMDESQLVDFIDAEGQEFKVL